MLHSIFIVVSIRAGEHWEISPQEAKQLSDAIAQVARHYPVVGSAKGADWLQLLIVVSALGVPRVFTSWDANRNRQGQQSPVPAVVAAAPPPTNGAMPGQPPRDTPGAIWRPQTPGELDPIGMAGSHATA